MAKTIVIADDVHELLRKGKFPGESFFDVIRRGMKRSLKLIYIALSGTITRDDWAKAQTALRNAELITLKGG